MSGLLAGKVWLSNLPRKLKPLAASLADIANDDGTSIYPSVAHMAWRLGASERLVQVNLAKLKSLGVLEVVANARGGRNLTVEYRMVEEKLPARSPWCRSRKGENHAPFKKTDAAANGEQPDPKGCSAGEKGSNSAHERAQTSAPDPSVSVSESLRSAPADIERQWSDGIQKLSRAKPFPFPTRPADPLSAELYEGIYWKGIENILFDTKRLAFPEQIDEAVKLATRDLFLNRTGKMMTLRPSDVEDEARKKVDRGINILEAVVDFSLRVRLSRDAIGNAVIATAVELLKRGIHASA